MLYLKVKMFKLLLIPLILGARCCAGAPTGPIYCSNRSDEHYQLLHETKELDDECRDHLFGGPVTRYEAIQILKSSLGLLNDSEGRNQRSTRYLQRSRNLVRMLTGEFILFPQVSEEPRFFGRSTPTPDPEYTPPKGERPEKHRFSDNSARIILDMVDRNKTTKSIQAMYPRYRPNRIGELRSQLAGESKMKQFEAIDQYVQQRVFDARNNFLIVRGWMIHNYGLWNMREKSG